jgi:hypothetical protein
VNAVNSSQANAEGIGSEAVDEAITLTAKHWLLCYRGNAPGAGNGRIFLFAIRGR